MPTRKVLITFLAGFLVAASAMPQGDSGQDTLLGLPFLQFTNGGIRVNFGGYHAEAGLGGLLGGSRAGGGLHASAGTPWGAHAAAGLGGTLGGDDATTGGGLYARAGLGNGRPEAAAGLGGMLDGSGRSAAPISGGLYAGATTGDDAVRFGDSGASASSDATANTGAAAKAEKSSGGRTNIQIVSRSGKRAEKLKQATADAPSEPGTSRDKEMRREAQSPVPLFGAEAGLFGAVFADGSVQKTKLKNGGVEVVESAPPAPPLPTFANEVLPPESVNVVAEKDVPPKVIEKPVHPRWRFRKRFWSGVPRKQIIYGYVPAEQMEAESSNARRISARAAENGAPTAETTTAPAPAPEYENNRDSTFFDDIFNIPQSTLEAVNGFLKNNSG